MQYISIFCTYSIQMTNYIIIWKTCCLSRMIFSDNLTANLFTYNNTRTLCEEVWKQSELNPIVLLWSTSKGKWEKNFTISFLKFVIIHQNDQNNQLYYWYVFFTNDAKLSLYTSSKCALPLLACSLNARFVNVKFILCWQQKISHIFISRQIHV